MKKIKSLLMLLVVFVMAIAMTGCGGSSSKDAFTGTWQRQLQKPVMAKAIDEMVIEKEKDAYFIKYFTWTYLNYDEFDKNGRQVKTPDGKWIWILRLSQRNNFGKTPAQKQGDSLVAKVGFSNVVITPKDNKIYVSGVEEKEIVFERKDEAKFKKMVDEHLEAKKVREGLVNPKGVVVKVDNAILEKK